MSAKFSVPGGQSSRITVCNWWRQHCLNTSLSKYCHYVLWIRFTLSRDLYDSCRLRCAVNVNVWQLFPAERTTRTYRTWGVRWEKENLRIAQETELLRSELQNHFRPYLKLVAIYSEI